MWMADKRLDFIAKVGVLVLVFWAGALALWWAGEATTNTEGRPRPEFGWAEFWLNRYQQLIAALIALAAAIAAAWPAWRQLGELTRQADQRSYDALRQRAADLAEEEAAIVKMRSLFGRARAVLDTLMTTNPVRVVDCKPMLADVLKPER